mgnify:CR=1 FL=1
MDALRSYADQSGRQCAGRVREGCRVPAFGLLVERVRRKHDEIPCQRCPGWRLRWRGVDLWAGLWQRGSAYARLLFYSTDCVKYHKIGSFYHPNPGEPSVKQMLLTESTISCRLRHSQLESARGGLARALGALGGRRYCCIGDTMHVQSTLRAAQSRHVGEFPAIVESRQVTPRSFPPLLTDRTLRRSWASPFIEICIPPDAESSMVRGILASWAGGGRSAGKSAAPRTSPPSFWARRASK